MRHVLLALVTALIVPAAAPHSALSQGIGQTGTRGSPDYPALWVAGQTYEAFHAGVIGRKDLWERNTTRANLPADLLERARAVPGTWRLLVVAFDRCSDSVSTIPYMAAVASAVDGVDLRIIPPELGRAIMEANRTPDGRAATPTVVLLRDDWTPAGAWVERPSELQDWFIRNPDGLSHDAQHYQKMDWYEADAGVSTVREIVELLESAG